MDGGDLGGLARAAPDPDALRLERLLLGLGGARGAGDDRAGVAHLLAGRRGEAGDVGDDRLGDVLGDVVGGTLLGVAADLADEHDQLGLGVVLVELEDVDEVGADDRVAADADDRGVAEAGLLELVADLVGQRARLGDDADRALGEELGGDDPDVGLAGREHAGAVRADQPDARPRLRLPVGRQHVVDRDALGDRDHRLDAGVDRLVDRGGGEAGRHEDHRGVGAGLVDGLLDRVEDRHAVDVLAALARGDAGDQVGAVVAVAEPVEAALAAGQAGDDELRVVADDDAHADPFASSTTCSAAPSIVFVVVEAVEVGLGEQLQALLGVGAVEADDQRHVHVDPRVGLDDALGDLVAAGDAAEDVEQDRVDLRVGGDDLERVDDRVGLRAAAGVEEVRGLAAGVGRRRRASTCRGRRRCRGCRRCRRASRRSGPSPWPSAPAGPRAASSSCGELLVAEEGGAVDRHLGVERDDLAVGGDDQRVDLDQRGVEVVEGARRASTRISATRSTTSSSIPASTAIAAASSSVEADQRVDVAADEGVGVALGDLLDVHAAHPREDHQRLLRGAVEDDRGVVLGVDLGRLPRPRPGGPGTGPRRAGRGCPCRGSRRRGHGPRRRPWRP